MMTNGGENMIAEMARQLIPQVLNSMQTMWHQGFAWHSWGQYFQRGQFGSWHFGRPSQSYGQYGQNYGQYGQNYGQYGQNYGQYGQSYGQYGRKHW
jgi:hypothetical protein